MSKECLPQNLVRGCAFLQAAAVRNQFEPAPDQQGEQATPQRVDMFIELNKFLDCLPLT